MIAVFYQVANIGVSENDVSALMGYTGAVDKDFFGSGSGILFTVAIISCFQKRLRNSKNYKR